MERKPQREIHRYASAEGFGGSKRGRLYGRPSASSRSINTSNKSPAHNYSNQSVTPVRSASSRSAAPDKKVTNRTSVRNSPDKIPTERKPAEKKPIVRKTTEKKKTSTRTRKKRSKLPLFAIVAAVLIVAAAIIIIVAASKVPEAKNLTIKSTDKTQVLTWERNGKNVSYEVYRKSNENVFALVRTIGEEDATTYTADSLDSATLYKYIVVTVKGKKKSNGVVIEGITTPVIAANLSANTQIEKSLTLVWEDSQNVSGYDIKIGSSNDLSDAITTTVSLDGITVDETTGLRSFSYDGLEEGAIYYFSVRSFCDKNIYSDWTPIISARVTRAVDMSGIDPSAPMVAITFDDGPDGSDVTTRILDAFAEAGGHGTFFQLGDHAEAQPEKIKRMVEEGHEVGNHTYDHTHMGGEVTSEDIINANNSIEKICGVRPYSFRCPGGESTDLIVDTCISEGMSVFHWSLDTRDWSSRDADAVISEIKKNVQDGDIILMHNIYSSTADAVEQILPWLTEQGYQLVTVSQLLQAKNGEPPIAGTTYKRSDYSW